MEDNFLVNFFTDRTTMDDSTIIAIIVLGLLMVFSIKPIKKMIRERKKDRKKKSIKRRRRIKH